MWQNDQFDFISGVPVFPWSRLFSSSQSQEMKNLTVGPWAPFLSYSSFYRTPRIIFPNNYLYSTLVQAHTSTWANLFMPTFSLTVTWQAPTSNSVSVQIHFWLHSVKTSFFHPSHLFANTYFWTSHHTILPVWNSLPYSYCKYFETLHQPSV